MTDLRGKDIGTVLRMIRQRIASDVDWVLATSHQRLGRLADQLWYTARTTKHSDLDIAKKVAVAGGEGNTPDTLGISGLFSEPFGAHVLYHGARLHQCKEIFPKAFPDTGGAPGLGYIRTASHGHTDSVYLAELGDIADVYGAATGFAGEIAGSRRFHPAGMRLGIDISGIAVQRITPDTSTAMTFVRGISDRVGITPGPLSTDNIVSVRFQVYDKILANPDVHLVADGFPTLERLGHDELRDSSLVLAQISDVADAVRTNYPHIDVSVGMNPLDAGEVIDLVKVTSVAGLVLGANEMFGTSAAGGQSDVRS